MDRGTINNVVNNGTGYDFDFAPSGHPSTARIGLPAGSISSGGSESRAVSQSFLNAPSVTAEESLVLWYTFNDLNASTMEMEDFSGKQADGLVSAGTLVPGKFAKALQQIPGSICLWMASCYPWPKLLLYLYGLKFWMIVLASWSGMVSFHSNTMMIISFAVMQAQVAAGWMPIPDYPVEDGCITFSPMMVPIFGFILMDKWLLRPLTPDTWHGAMGVIIIFI